LEASDLEPFFRQRPNLIAQRLWTVSTTLLKAQRDWQTSLAQSQDDGQARGVSAADALRPDSGRTTDNHDDNSISPTEARAQQLCQSIATLGPVAVKVGQTLSQRPDLVGKEAALALKRLQTQTKAFDDFLAYQVLHTSLNYWQGPLAPGLDYGNLDDPNHNPLSQVDLDGPTYFAQMTASPVASASLGQVYRATRHDGLEVAVKVQRPDALAILAQDAQCFRTVFRAKGAWDEYVAPLLAPKAPQKVEGGFTEAEMRQGELSAGAVIDRVARDIQKELDYRLEAANSNRFRESLEFLGFCTTPTVVHATDRVLQTEWIPGRHLSDCNTQEGLALTRMAVEACTASMVLTGFVHADPHEGNLMLHKDGRVVFLDFGLMSEVNVVNMEGFARGIQGLLSENWLALTEAFVDVGFVTSPIMHRNSVEEMWRVDPNYGVAELAQELEQAMKTTEGGVSRFGALATVLNKSISPTWLVFTPPYVLLLIRTFLTLEGMAASIDPDFNIYEMAMPWAVKRSLSPSTEKGIQVFRQTLLTEENQIQWQRILDLLAASQNNDEGVDTITETSATVQATAAKRNAALQDAIASLLGSSDGRALRRALMDVDLVDVLVKLSSPEARPLLQQAMAKKKKTPPVEVAETVEPDVAAPLPEPTTTVTPAFAHMKQVQRKWRHRVYRLLVVHHVKQVLRHWRGWTATARLAWVTTRVYIQTRWFPRQSAAGASSNQQPEDVSNKGVNGAPPVAIAAA